MKCRRPLHSSFKQQQTPRNVSELLCDFFTWMSILGLLSLICWFVCLFCFGSKIPFDPQSSLCYPNYIIMTLEMSALTFHWFELLPGSARLYQVLKSHTFYPFITSTFPHISIRE